MQAEKERIIRIIETMPEDKLQAVVEAVDEIEDQDQDLDFDWDSPLFKDITIRTREDFNRIVQKGLDDVKAGRVHSLEETIAYMESF